MKFVRDWQVIFSWIPCILICALEFFTLDVRSLLKEFLCKKKKFKEFLEQWVMRKRIVELRNFIRFLRVFKWYVSFSILFQFKKKVYSIFHNVSYVVLFNLPLFSNLLNFWKFLGLKISKLQSFVPLSTHFNFFPKIKPIPSFSKPKFLHRTQQLIFINSPRPQVITEHF